MFMAPFTNLHFCGAATNRIKYSKENQPTKTASATAKKMCSSSRPSSWRSRRIWQKGVTLGRIHDMSQCHGGEHLTLI